MNLASNIPSTAIPLKFSISSCFLPRTPKPHRTTTTIPFQISNSKIIPARDRVIDFGKYKGKMLGSLPSNYLKWVSKNLRAGDTEEWAKLGDEVLSDPVYGDRIEWELAEKILNGNAASPISSGNGGNAVSELLEISQRFGWDNQDKGGWSEIDFGLLGTSKGGRIPRLVGGRNCDHEVGSLKKKKKEKIRVEEMMWEEDGGRRRGRRERMRRRRLETSGGGTGTLGRRMGEVEEININGEGEGEGEGREDNPNPVEVVGGPFPGREALLQKVLNRRQRF